MERLGGGVQWRVVYSGGVRGWCTVEGLEGGVQWRG